MNFSFRLAPRLPAAPPVPTLAPRPALPPAVAPGTCGPCREGSCVQPLRTGLGLVTWWDGSPWLRTKLPWAVPSARAGGATQAPGKKAEPARDLQRRAHSEWGRKAGGWQRREALVTPPHLRPGAEGGRGCSAPLRRPPGWGRAGLQAGSCLGVSGEDPARRGGYGGPHSPSWSPR